MPSTDRRLELKVKDIDGSDRLTAGCVLMDLASPAVSRTAAYAKGLMGLTNSPLCKRCGAQEETSAHVLCECETLASLRRAHRHAPHNVLVNERRHIRRW
jgi:hypothetical protein